jgi:hypothetical protein
MYRSDAQLGEIEVLGQAVTIVYVLPLLVLPPELDEDEPLAQPAIAETEAKATAMAEIVLFPRIYPALLARCHPALTTQLVEVVRCEFAFPALRGAGNAVGPEAKPSRLLNLL